MPKCEDCGQTYKKKEGLVLHKDLFHPDFDLKCPNPKNCTCLSCQLECCARGNPEECCHDCDTQNEEA